MGLKWCGGTAVLAFALLLAVALAPRALAADPLSGVALVIGNGDYAHLPALANPEDDADAVEELLSDLGFDSVRRTDRDAEDLARDLDRFVEDAAEADVAVLYYAGHGIEAGGENFLVPIDADLSALEAASERLVPLSEVLARLRETVPVTILLLDACRDNPFPPGATLKLAAGAEPLPISAGGLAETRGARALSASDDAENFGVVIGFAAEPGKPALDGQPGEHSPYAAALTRHLAAMAGEEFGTVMRMVAEEVYLKTSGRQRPWVNESLRRLLFFGETPAPLAGPEGEILAERRQLLVTIAALPDFERRQVERVAADGGVPMDGVYAMLKALGSNAPDDPAELDAVLRRQAEQLKAFLAERRIIENPDPELARLAALTDHAVAEGAIAAARRLRGEVDRRIDELSAVIEREEDLIRARRTEFAAEYARSAEISALVFDHGEAARYYARAADQVARWDDTLALSYRLREVEERIRRGRVSGDRESLELAAALARDLVAETRHAPQQSAEARLALAGAFYAIAVREPGTAGLAPVTALIRQSLDALPAGRSRALAYQRIGDIELEIGTRGGRDDAALDRAITAYRQALREVDAEHDAREWADIQLNLASTLLQRALADIDVDLVREGIAALEAARAIYNRADDPVGRARVQFSLGAATVALPFIERHRQGEELVDSERRQAFRQVIAMLRAGIADVPRDRFPAAWANQHFIFAQAMVDEAVQAAPGELAEAIRSLELALEVWTRASHPLNWANAQEQLAFARKRIGNDSRDVPTLRQAAKAFEAALTVFGADSAPSRRVSVQIELGRTLMDIAALTDDPADEALAVAAHRDALGDVGDTASAADTHSLRHNLGMALTDLGLARSDPAPLLEAIGSFEAALAAISREADPARWANTQNSLGIAYLARGETFGEADALAHAIEAFHAALETYDQTQNPEEWARVQSNLGNTHRVIGERTGSRDALLAAVEAYEAAGTARTRTKKPLLWAADWRHRAYAMLHLGIDESDPALIEKARQGLGEVLAVLSPDEHPSEWAYAKVHDADALRKLGDLKRDEGLVEQALTAYREALARVPADKSLRVAEILDQIGGALSLLGSMRQDANLFRQAIETLDRAIAQRPRDKVLRAWAESQFSRANAYDNLSRVEHNVEHVDQALEGYSAALDGYSRESDPRDWAYIQRQIGNLLSDVRDDEGAAEAFRAGLDALPPDRDPALYAELRHRYAVALKYAALGDIAKLADAAKELRALLAGDLLADANRPKIHYELGQALLTIAKARNDAAMMVDAAGHLELAAAGYAPEPDVIYSWGAAHYGLAEAAFFLGQRENGTERLEQAAAAYKTLSAHLPPRWHDGDKAEILMKAGNVQRLLAARGADPERLDAALAFYRRGLEFAGRGSLPELWADLTLNIAAIEKSNGTAAAGTEVLRRAAGLYRAGLETLDPAARRHDWGLAQQHLGETLSLIGERDGDLDALLAAAEHMGKAATVFTRDATPDRWALNANTHGWSLILAGRRGGGAELYERAIALLRDAVAVHHELADMRNVGFAEDSLCLALVELGKARGDRAMVEEGLAVCDDAIAHLRENGHAGVAEGTLAHVALGRSLLAELPAE
ncbi:caspase family protein [Nitratireductor mangrovi]|nr:caspase family protein [Nitratireductor mangrovi]